MTHVPSFDVVVPTVGRASLIGLLRALSCAAGPPPRRVVVVDDRPDGPPLDLWPVGSVEDVLTVVRSGGRGPASARNLGVRLTAAPWVVFLDDDVVPESTWRSDLAVDLGSAGSATGAVSGRVRVPLPEDRRPTDWERDVAGLEVAQWITADLAVRRTALAEVGGFDERFPRAYREDADLALRLVARGWRIEAGRRGVVHPVRPAPRLVSIARQRGNADDALMRALHGRGWRPRCGAAPSRLAQHAAAVGLACGAAAALLARRRTAAVGLGAAWLAVTGRFAWRRIAPGPRTAAEVAAMAVTSAAIPFAAVGHRLLGERRARRLATTGTAAARKASITVERTSRSAFADRDVGAVLFDRDGTLVRDVPYNGDPDRVELVPGAREAVGRLRRAGLRVGVVTNQSGVARGLIGPVDVARVNRRIDELAGPFDVWAVCPHGPSDRCACRKPAPGLVVRAARQLDVTPARCVVVGDIGADVAAARAAGAWPVLVPTAVTRADEVRTAEVVCASLADAVDLVLGGGAGGDRTGRLQESA